MAPRKRRVFTAEFKADAVRLCRAGDRSIGHVAKDMDLGETALRAWLDELGALALYAFATRFSSAEAEAWGHARSWAGDRFYVYTRSDDEAALAAVWLVGCTDAVAAASLQAALAGFAEPRLLPYRSEQAVSNVHVSQLNCCNRKRAKGGSRC